MAAARSVPRGPRSGGRTSPSRASAASATGAGSATSTRTGSASTDAEVLDAHPRARHPARLAGRVDLPVPRRPHPGHRHRPGGPQAVPLPPALARAARPEKFDDMVGFARALPRLREHVATRLALDDLSASTCSPCAVRLLDRGFFRIGSEDYAVRNETYGLATMKKRHVRPRRRHAASSTTPPSTASAASRRSWTPRSPTTIDRLKRRRGGGDELLAYKRGRPLGRRQVGRHQPLPEGRDRPRRLRQGLPDVGGDRARRHRPVGQRRGAAHLEDGREADRQPRRQGGRATTSATPRRSRGPRTSTRASSTASATGRRSPRGVVAADGGTAIQGAVEEAVLALLEG